MSSLLTLNFLFHPNLSHPESPQVLNLKPRRVRLNYFRAMRVQKVSWPFKSSLTIRQVFSVLSDTVTESQLRKHHRHAGQQNAHPAKLKAVMCLRINCPPHFKQLLTPSLRHRFYFKPTNWFISYVRQNRMFWWAHASPSGSKVSRAET